MKKLSYRTIICVVLYVILCIAMLDFLYRFTQPQTTNEIASVYAKANVSSVASGAFVVGFLFAAGMFLFTLSIKKTDWLLLLLVLSYAFLTLNTMAAPCGQYFFKPSISSVLSCKILQYIPSHTVLLFLLLKQDKQFWSYFFYNSKLAGIAFFAAFVISWIFHGNFYNVIHTAVRNLILHGQFNQIITVLTILALFACTIITLYCFIKDRASVKVQENALDVKNDIISEIYEILKDSIIMSHTMDQQLQKDINVLEDCLEKGQYSLLKENLETFKRNASSVQQVHYCENPVIQLLLTQYECLARKNQIAFLVDAVLPEQLGDVERDLYTFLINALNNSIEANQKIQESERRSLRLSLHYESGFLSIYCENPYTGQLLKDACGNLLTTKEELHREALGIQQMKQIAAKYKNTLSIQTEEHVFTIHTALRI